MENKKMENIIIGVFAGGIIFLAFMFFILYNDKTEKSSSTKEYNNAVSKYNETQAEIDALDEEIYCLDTILDNTNSKGEVNMSKIPYKCKKYVYRYAK